MQPSDRTILRVSGVHKSFSSAGGSTPALNGINLEVAAGSFLSIIGPSGCGKSTLLQIMAGLVKPTKGTVFYERDAVDGPPPGVLYVFQQYTRSLFPWKTVKSNVAFGLESKGDMSRSEIDTRTCDLIALVKLTGFERHYPWQLSGGMQQRASIARALSFDPELLLMDEPFGALDEIVRDKLNEQLLRLWDVTKKTVLFVTHSIPEAVFLSTRIVVMSPRPGRIHDVIECGFPRDRTLDIRETPEFLEVAHRVRDGLRAGHSYDD